MFTQEAAATGTNPSRKFPEAWKRILEALLSEFMD